MGTGPPARMAEHGPRCSSTCGVWLGWACVAGVESRRARGSERRTDICQNGMQHVVTCDVLWHMAAGRGGGHGAWARGGERREVSSEAYLEQRSLERNRPGTQPGRAAGREESGCRCGCVYVSIIRQTHARTTGSQAIPHPRCFGVCCVGSCRVSLVLGRAEHDLLDHRLLRPADLDVRLDRAVRGHPAPGPQVVVGPAARPEEVASRFGLAVRGDPA